MKGFLKLNVAFAIIFITIIGGAILTNRIISTQLLKAIDSSTNTIILGASRTAYGVNDNLLSHTINASGRGEGLFYSYLKLKIFSKNQPNLKRVILCLGPVNLYKGLENNWFSSASIEARTPKMLHFFSFSDIKLSWQYNSKSTLRSIILTPKYTSKLIKNILTKGGTYRSLNLGQFFASEENRLEQSKQNQNHESDSAYSFSELEMGNLRDIYNYCKENSIELIFINPPLYKMGRTKNNDFINFLNSAYPDIQYYDYSELNLSDSCFLDFSHLNKYGAEIFTQKLIDDGVAY